MRDAFCLNSQDVSRVFLLGLFFPDMNLWDSQIVIVYGRLFIFIFCHFLLNKSRIRPKAR